MTRLAFIGVALVATAPSLLAQSNDLGYTPPSAPLPFDPTSLLLKLLILTGVVLALCAGMILWGKSKPKATGEPGSSIVLEGSLPLDRRSSLHILKVEGQSVAVTTDSSGLKSIVVLSEDELIPR